MKNVSEILQETRESKNISIEEVSKILKIKQTFIIALEKGEYDKLPSQSTTKGFIKIYAKYLGINTENIIAMFRRECKVVEGHQMKNKKNKVRIPFILHSKTFFTILTIIIILGVIIIYALHEYSIYKTPPILTILSPSKDSISTYNSSITIKGKTQIGNNITINGAGISNLDTNGDFSVNVGLQYGMNKIVIIAKNQLGIVNQRIVDVDYLNKQAMLQKQEDTFSITIKAIYSPTFVEAQSQNNTLYKGIINTNSSIKVTGVSSIIINTGEIQNIEIYYHSKSYIMNGNGLGLILVKYKNGGITISKS